jgi:UDP-N-acetylglucosamine acyltransferase
VNAIGLRRRGFAEERITRIHDIYRLLFVVNHNTSKALSLIESEFEPSEDRDLILNFVRNSERGIMKGYTNGKYDDSAE